MFEEMTREAIQTALVTDLEAAGWSVQEGSFAALLAGPIAHQLAEVYASLGELVSAFYVDETSGQYLDLTGEMLGIYRKVEELSDGSVSVESDGDYYARIAQARQQPATSGNCAHYRQWATEVEGVTAAKVLPLHDGYGTVRVCLAGEGGLPPSEEVVSACTQHLEGCRPVGATVFVSAAVQKTVNVAATVRLDGTRTQGAVEADIRQGLEDYFAAVREVWSQSGDGNYSLSLVRASACMVLCDGVADVSAVKLNNTAASVTLGATVVPVLGEVRLTWT